MRIARYPKRRITNTQRRLESRRLKVARMRRRGMSLRQIAKAVDVGYSTAWRDVAFITTVWMPLAGLSDPPEAHIARLRHVLMATWPNADARLVKRLRRILLDRHAVIRDWTGK